MKLSYIPIHKCPYHLPRMAFHWASLTCRDLARLPGVHEDRPSAEGFVLETHVFSKPVSQNGRKCPHGQRLSLW